MIIDATQTGGRLPVTGDTKSPSETVQTGDPLAPDEPGVHGSADHTLETSATKSRTTPSLLSRTSINLLNTPVPFLPPGAPDLPVLPQIAGLPSPQGKFLSRNGSPCSLEQPREVETFRAGGTRKAVRALLCVSL